MMASELATEETTGQQLVRLWQESWEAEQLANMQCRHLDAVRFGAVRGGSDEANDQAMAALHEKRQVDGRLRSLVRILVGEQVLVQPLGEQTSISYHAIFDRGLAQPIAEGRSMLASELNGRVTMGGSVPVDGRDPLVLKRNSIKSFFKLPGEFGIDILDLKTGEPRVKITVT